MPVGLFPTGISILFFSKILNDAITGGGYTDYTNDVGIVTTNPSGLNTLDLINSYKFEYNSQAKIARFEFQMKEISLNRDFTGNTYTIFRSIIQSTYSRIDVGSVVKSSNNLGSQYNMQINSNNMDIYLWCPSGYPHNFSSTTLSGSYVYSGS